ncbi:MAG: hypothetical protein HOV67_06250, partial [Kribbellaceae bacterium]|nr:hypothetical protein [Kribbellaceae bacterium]
MFRKLLVAALALIVSAAVFVFVDRAADAAAANVSITATQATTGTTTLTYRATVVKAGTIREVTMAIPAGTTGRVTSINGTVSSVTRTVLRWRPSRVVTVAVGARLAIPLYGLKLPAGGPWTLGFKSIGTANQVITSGAGVLQPLRTYTPQVAVYTSNPIPGQTTNLIYQATVTRAGTLAAVRMQLPTDATGTYTTINGTLAVSGGYATWKPNAPISVAAGARLGIPVNGVKLSRFGGTMSLSVSATTSTGTVLTSGSTNVTYIAPPAEMPVLEEGAIAGPAPDCPATWPTTTAENAKTGTADWVISTAANPDLAAYLTKVSAACGDTVDLKVTSGNDVSVVAYRMGYYGGLGAREVWRKDGVPTVVQP